MRISKIIIALATCGGLAACGDTIGDQAIAGTAVGAAAAVVTSGHMVQGAAIGAAANIAYCQTYPARC